MLFLLRALGIVGWALTVVHGAVASGDELESTQEEMRVERWRLMHEAMYQHDQTIPLRLEARQKQKAWFETRRALDTYLHASFTEYRALRHEMNRAFETAQETREDVLGLEKDLAASENINSPELSSKKKEHATVSRRMQEQYDSARKLAEQMERLREELAEQDAEAGDWLRLEQRAHEKFEEAMRVLNEHIRSSPKLEYHEARRIRQNDALLQKNQSSRDRVNLQPSSRVFREEMDQPDRIMR
jgi:hypothetical protein